MYVAVPPNMQGNMLVSRHELAKIDKNLAQEAARKYDNRPKLRDMHLPHLDCLWGDLIFLTPYDPAEQMRIYYNLTLFCLNLII